MTHLKQHPEMVFTFTLVTDNTPEPPFIVDQTFNPITINLEVLGVSDTVYTVKIPEDVPVGSPFGIGLRTNFDDYAPEVVPVLISAD